jgi:adenylate kinase family enzyme
MQRIVVTGTPGSGKSTLARELAAQHNLPYFELAAVYWRDGWQTAPPDEFRGVVEEIAAGEHWVIDGLYLKEITWARADTLVWLDYPLALVLWRLLRRSWRRVRTGETLWQTDNRETWRRVIFSRESLLWSALTQHHRRRRSYARRLRQPEYAHLKVIRLTKPEFAHFEPTC